MLVGAGGNWYPPTTAQVESGVQYGVGGTSLTGTLPTAPTLATIAGAYSPGSMVWEIFFSEQPQSSSTPGDAEPNILWHSSSTGLWYALLYLQVTISNGVQWTNIAGVNDFDMVVIIDQPLTTSMVSGNLVQLGPPTAA